MMQQLDRIVRQLGRFGTTGMLGGSLITLALRGTGLLLGYTLVFALSKIAGPEGVGFYQTMLQVLNVFGMLLAMGMNMSVLRFAGQFNNPDEQSKLHLLCRHTIHIVGPTSVFLSLVLFVSADEVSLRFSESLEYTSGLKLIALGLPFFTANKLAVEFIRGMQKLHISELVRSVIRPGMMMTGLLIAFHSGIENDEILYLLLSGIFLNFVVSWRSVTGILKAIPVGPHSFSRINFFRTSLPMMGTSVASALLLAMPVLFIGLWCTQAEVGIYSVAFRLAALISLLLMVLETVVAPKLTELFWANALGDLQTTVRKATSLVFWTSALAAAVLICFGKWALGLFGPEFLSGYSVLVVLSLGNVLAASFGPVGVLLNMTGEHKKARNIIFVATVIAAVSYVIFGSAASLVVFAAIQSTGKVVNSVLAARVALKTHGIWTFIVPMQTKCIERS